MYSLSGTIYSQLMISMKLQKRSNIKSLHNFMVINYGVPNNNVQNFLLHYRNLLHYLKELFISVSIWKSNLKFCLVTSTKDTHQIPKTLDICRWVFKHWRLNANYTNPQSCKVKLTDAMNLVKSTYFKCISDKITITILPHCKLTGQ